MVPTMSSNTRGQRWIELPNSWILRRPIDGKSAPLVAVDDRKWKVVTWGVKPRRWLGQNPSKSMAIMDSSWCFMASFGGLPVGYRRRGWVWNDGRLKSFPLVPSFASGVTESGSYGRVGFRSKVSGFQVKNGSTVWKVASWHRPSRWPAIVEEGGAASLDEEI